MITPLTNAVLCAHLEKCMPLVDYDAKLSSHGYETKIALYSIDCVRKLLLNHRFDNEYLFERLDEGREAEMKEDSDFWEASPSQQVSLISFSNIKREYLCCLELFLCGKQKIQ